MQPYKHNWAKIEADRRIKANKADSFDVYFKVLSVTSDYLIRWSGKKIKAKVPVHLLFKNEGKLEFKMVKVVELIQEKTVTVRDLDVKNLGQLMSFSIEDYKKTWWVKGG